MLWIVVFLLVLVGCGGDKKSPNDILKDTQHRTYERVIRKKDGKEMVLIRGGNFEMGDAKSDPEEWMEDAKEIHSVELDSFYMDVHEVTVGEFKQFISFSDYN